MKKEVTVLYYCYSSRFWMTSAGGLKILSLKLPGHESRTLAVYSASIEEHLRPQLGESE